MKVSVVVVTYNHAALIDQALASVLTQRTHFDFEVLVSEDASTDGTRTIVERWREKHPERVRLLLSERNLKSNEVVARGFREAAGKYVALLDGDDYWTSPNKLQAQADLLDAHPEAVLCFHDAEVIEANGTPPRRYTPATQKTRLTLDDFWEGNPFATCTSMFRRGAVATIPGWFADFFPVTDWPLYVLFAREGDAIYVPEVMGAYRRHAGGLYSSRSELDKLRSTDEFYRRINRAFDFCYDRRIRQAHRRYFFDWARAYGARGELELARTSLGLGLGYGWPRTPPAIFEATKLFAWLYGPLARRERSPDRS